MKIRLSRRLVKFMSVFAVLLLSVLLLLSRVTTVKRPEPIPLSAEEFKLISPDTYHYIYDQPAVCRDRSPFLVFMVPVAAAETEARKAVRQTWGSAGRDTLTVFFLGLPEGGAAPGVREKLREENRTYADIIQMNFVDSYQNLTIKTMMMMTWLATHCPNASYAMKVDADIFVNVFSLLQRLQDCPQHDFIMGSVISDGRPRRDSRSKWRLTEHQYPEDRFPPYISGAGYVFSADLASRISFASRFVRVIPLEDVYVGLCLQVLGVHPQYARTILPLRNLFEIRTLEYDRCTFSRLLIANQFPPAKLLTAWQDFSTGHTSC